jgi:hypothetical protein
LVSNIHSDYLHVSETSIANAAKRKTWTHLSP